MSLYPTVEAAVLTLLRAYPDIAFDTGNSSLRKYRVLDAKGTKWAAVLQQHRASRFGFDLRNRATQGRRQEEHFVRIELYVKVGQAQGGEDVAYEAVRDGAADLVPYLNSYPRLNDVAGVKRATVDEVGAPIPVAKRSSPEASTHYSCDVIVTVFCEVPYVTVEAGQ